MVTAGLCKLAFWQWQRGMEKTAWLAQMAKMQQAGPRTLAQIDWQHPESLDGQPLQGKAEWVSPYVWLLDNQIVNGEVGYDVLIPVRAEGDPHCCWSTWDGCLRHPIGRNCPIPPSPPQ